MIDLFVNIFSKETIMPLYNYHCSSCEQTFEIQHKMAEAAPNKGPGCTNAHCHLEKQLSQVASVIRSANPFVSKSGQPLPNSAPSSTTRQSEEKTHVCGSGCAMHKY